MKSFHALKQSLKGAINMSEFENRRERLFALMKENSALILFSGIGKICSEDEQFPFKSNRNFFYLTQIEQDHSAIVLVKGIGEKKVYLFIDEYSEMKEKWTGKRLTFEEAQYLSDLKSVYSMNTLDTMMNMILTKDNNQYGNITTLYVDQSPELKIEQAFSTVDYVEKMKESFPHVEIENAYPLVRDLRMVKSQEEINNIVKAIEMTNNGICQLILNMKPGLYEYELADMFEFYGRSHDRHPLAFSTIVAAGSSAICLHHPVEQQNVMIKDNQLVLFDLGFSHEGYSADISRTYPINGKYEGNQRLVYQVVLECNKAVIEQIKPGITIAELQGFAKEFLKRKCVEMNLMRDDEEIVKYYYHNVSHHLGLDTHDASLRDRPLENGNVITVEPGLYFANLGIGVRIEDDVLLEDGKPVVLSRNIAKEISDIERLFSSKGR